jgi:hypothetical protein
VVGTDVEETVEAAQIISDVRMESVCVTLTAKTKPVGLMAVVEPVEPVMPHRSCIVVIQPTESQTNVTESVVPVVMESVLIQKRP